MIDPRELLDRQHAWFASAQTGGAAAEAHAKEILTGAAIAIARLHQNLNRIRYPRVPGRIRCARGLDGRLHRLSGVLGGELPPALRVFWRCIGGVSFADLETYRHVAFWAERGVEGPAGFSDAFHVDPCAPDWVAGVEACHAEWVSESPGGPTRAFEVDIAPDGFHKDDISGGAPYAFHVRSDWLAPLLNFDWSGHVRPASIPAGALDLVSVTRTTILECAGFPAFLGSPAFEPFRARLLADVPAF